MKKLLLPGLILLAATPLRGADNLNLAEGKNDVEFSGSNTAVYSYTPTSDQILVFSGMTNCNINTSGIKPSDQAITDIFASKVYVQTRANVSYTIDVTKGYGSEASSFEAEMTPVAWPDGSSWEAPVVPGAAMSFVPLSYGSPTYLKYTAGEDGVLIMMFSASPGLSYSTTPDGPFANVATGYMDGGGYKGKLDIAAGQTFYFKLTGFTTMLCSFEVVQPIDGSSPDFPIAVRPGEQTVFPKTAGTYYYTIANGGNDGYLLIEGDEAFKGKAEAGTSFSYLSTTSTDEIKLRVSVSSSTRSYCLRLTRTEDAAADQNFTATYTAEAYDSFPGEALPDGTDAKITTAPYPGTYYYTFTLPEDGRKIMEIKPEGELKSELTKATLYYSDNRFTVLASGTEINYEGAPGRGYTIAWEVGEEDVPLTFSVKYTAPGEGDSMDNPLTAVLGENAVPEGRTKYLLYTAGIDGWLTIAPAADSGLKMPAVSMMPTEADPYMQACEVVDENGVYKVLCQKDRGYLIIFSNVGPDAKFTLGEVSGTQGENAADPFIAEDGENAVPAAAGTYWYKYTAPMAGKLEISTNLAYKREPNHQDYTYVYYYRPDNLDTRAGELRPDLDNGSFINRVLTVAEGDVYYVKLRTLDEQDGIWVNFNARQAALGETPDMPIEIPFDGLHGEYTFNTIINHEKDGLWYSIGLKPGLFTMMGSTSETFEMSLYSKDDTQNALVKSSQLAVDYDSAAERYVFTWGIDRFAIEAEGTYLIHVSDNAAPLTMEMWGQTDGIADAGLEGVAVAGGLGSITVMTSSATAVTVAGMNGSVAATATVDGQRRFDVAPGIYVVKVAEKVFKVAVK